MLSPEEKQTLLQLHYHSPPLRRRLQENQGVSVENPSCGDKVRVQIEDLGGKLQWSFDAEGCTITQTSASIMASMVNELNPIRAAERIRQVLSVYRGEAPREEIRELGEMQVFQEILDKPVRLKCVLLPWRTAEKALNLFMKAHKSPNQSP